MSITKTAPAPDFMLLWNTGRFDDIRLETEPG